MAIISIVYILAAVCSLLSLVAYCILIKNKFTWFWVLFASISVVNVGYFVLSISKTLEEALLANRIAYLGSVFLPMSMLLIILNATKLNYKKWIWIPLACVAMVVFFIAASPGYSEIYYTNETKLIFVDGVSVLDKEYGPLHITYMFYLLIYFAVMMVAVMHATLKKKINSTAQAIMLLSAVFVNICVWLLEQFVTIEFEFLSVSYIISELFLIGTYLMIQDAEKKIACARELVMLEKTLDKGDDFNKAQFSEEQIKVFKAGIEGLTQTEKLIYDLYIEGKGTKEVLSELNIKENTLKYHNKNIYGKLGVPSRKILKEMAKTISI